MRQRAHCRRYARGGVPLGEPWDVAPSGPFCAFVGCLRGRCSGCLQRLLLVVVPARVPAQRRGCGPATGQARRFSGSTADRRWMLTSASSRDWRCAGLFGAATPMADGARSATATCSWCPLPRSSASVGRPAARGGTSHPGRRRTRRAARTACARARPRGRPHRPPRGTAYCRRGIHDAELVERVWEHDLRVEGVVVEPRRGSTTDAWVITG